MTDTDTEATTTTEVDADAVDTETVTTDEQTDKPHREAAKYRTKLREAEAQVAELTARVEGLQRAQVDAAIEASGVKAKAVWAAGTELADLLGDDGLPDPAKVKKAVDAAREQFGITGRTVATGLRSGASGTRPEPQGFAAAFKAQR